MWNNGKKGIQKSLKINILYSSSIDVLIFYDDS